MQEPIHLQTKWCPKCDKWLSFREFSLDRRSRDGLVPYCKKCTSSYTKSIRTPGKAREYRIKATYKDFSVKQYDHMFAEQGGVCYICKQAETTKSHDGGIASLVIDHDHQTGEVRMLLCRKCNITLGYVEKDPELTRKLMEYREEMKNRKPNVKVAQFPTFDNDGTNIN